MNSMAYPTVAIVIPALNEAEALQQMLPALQVYRPGWIIVVDNHSTDATPEVARAAGAVVVHETQRGYGCACWRGFQQACELGAQVVVFMDGDGSDNPTDLPAMLAPLLADQADLVMGSRVSKLAEPGAVPPQARLGNWLVSHLIGLRYHLSLHDVGSFRAIKCALLLQLGMHEMTYGWPVEMLTKAARAGYRIVEVDLHYRVRTHGRSKVAGTLLGSLKAAYYMLRTTWRYAGLHRWHREGTALVVMARAPEIGRGKTRLAATLGDEATLKLYQAFLTDLARRFVSQPFTLFWACTPASADFAGMLAELDPHLPATRTFPQSGPDFATRLYYAFYQAFGQGFAKVVLIGSDTPQITRELVLEAERALDDFDVVLGPAEDGGYYLMALRSPYDLFTGIPMSTSEVLQMTMQRASDLHLRVHLLDPLFDVDDQQTLLQLQALLHAQPSLAPVTASYLATLSDLRKELV